MDTMTDVEYIARNTNELAVLIAFAEEANELSKAAMKLARAKGLIENPTPISIVEAEADLIEEYNDLLNCRSMLNKIAGLVIDEDFEIRTKKYGRWAERIKSRKEELEG